MRLQIEGNITDLTATVQEAVDKWFEKIITDSPELAEALDKAETQVSSVTVDFQFKLEGAEQWQVLTTDNHEGIAELLTVNAETDEEGNLLWDTVKDNDGDSNFNAVEALITQGIDSEFTEIESVYSDTEFTEVLRYTMNADTTVELCSTYEEAVIQVYKQCKLVTEVAFPIEQYDALAEHYAELADLNS